MGQIVASYHNVIPCILPTIHADGQTNGAKSDAPLCGGSLLTTNMGAGVIVSAAKRIGIPLMEYAYRLSIGERWCWRGQHWVLKHNMHKHQTGSCQDCVRAYRSQKARDQRKADREARKVSRGTP